MKVELIKSVNAIVVSKGSNTGKTMYVINGTHWSKIEPKREETHVCLEEVDGEGKHEGKKFINVIGFSQDTRMDVSAKIELLKQHEAEYSQAIAYLLK